jgi:AmiR/NasT family two-component response regulator
MPEATGQVETGVAGIPAARFLLAARLCRTRDLERLFALGELVRSINELIHGLQRERGASSIVLGSQGVSFRNRLEQQVSVCAELERDVRARLENIDQKLDGMSFGARFYIRGAQAFRALDGLTDLRQQIEALAVAPQDAVRKFSEIIGCLLGVGFEVADIAADPEISRALISLANFAQGKEYAGQERATAGAAFSRGRCEATEQHRLRKLIDSQDQAFRIFSEFAVPIHLAAFRSVVHGNDSAEVKRMRRMALGREPMREAPSAIADAWFRHTTARIDAMKVVEDQMTTDLSRLCTVKLTEARRDPGATDRTQSSELATTAPVAMLVPDSSPALNDLGLSGGVALYTLDATLPKPMRSILDVIHAQSRRLNRVSHELESARAALAERKAIERAKGLLMTSRRVSEKQAYDLIRDTAMSQNKRIAEIAEAIISMADIL